MDSTVMTLEVYLDGHLQNTETVDPSTLAAGEEYHTWIYAYGVVVLRSRTTKPHYTQDPDSYSIQWYAPLWTTTQAANSCRGRYPCHIGNATYDFTAAITEGGSTRTVDFVNYEIDYTLAEYDPPTTCRMLTAKVKVYFTSQAKTHLIFRDPSTRKIVHASANGLVRDD